jgi:hypothetical protein
MEHAVVWFSFETVVIGGLLLALAIFVFGMCCGHWLGRDRHSARPLVETDFIPRRVARTR